MLAHFQAKCKNNILTDFNQVTNSKNYKILILDQNLCLSCESHNRSLFCLNLGDKDVGNVDCMGVETISYFGLLKRIGYNRFHWLCDKVLQS